MSATVDSLIVQHCAYLSSDAILWATISLSVTLAMSYVAVAWNILKSASRAGFASLGLASWLIWGFILVFLTCGGGTHLARVLPLFRGLPSENQWSLEVIALAVACAASVPSAIGLWWKRPVITHWLGAIREILERRQGSNSE